MSGCDIALFHCDLVKLLVVKITFIEMSSKSYNRVILMSMYCCDMVLFHYDSVQLLERSWFAQGHLQI